MATTSDKCSLLGLPGEIKNKIWREVFNSSCVTLSDKADGRPITVKLDSFNPEIFRTCKTVYREARPILASSTSIVLNNCASSQLNPATTAFYFPLANSLTLNESIKEPLIVSQFHALRVLELCDSCLSTTAMLSIACSQRRISSYMNGHHDMAVVRRSLQMLKTHVRNAELRKLLDKQDQKFQVLLSVTFMSLSFPSGTDKFDHARICFDVNTRRVLRRYSYRTDTHRATTWDAGQIMTYQYEADSVDPFSNLQEVVKEVPWAQNEEIKTYDAFVPGDFESWSVHGHIKENGRFGYVKEE